MLPSPWNGQDVVANITGFLGASADGGVLSGTASDPTALIFGVTRSRFRDLRGANSPSHEALPHEYGLQMSWLMGDNDNRKKDEERVAASVVGGGSGQELRADAGLDPLPDTPSDCARGGVS